MKSKSKVNKNVGQSYNCELCDYHTRYYVVFATGHLICNQCMEDKHWHTKIKEKEATMKDGGAIGLATTE